jgi:hypothetical protein
MLMVRHVHDSMTYEETGCILHYDDDVYLCATVLLLLPLLLFVNCLLIANSNGLRVSQPCSMF